MINKSVNRKTCRVCGTCFSVCPKNAITLKKTRASYIVHVDEEKCIRCGLCLKVCPVLNTNLNELKFSVFNKIPKDKLLGNFNGCYLGYSNNPNLRLSSSSGGVVTTLLTELLEKNIIDAAVVTKFSKNNPFEGKPIITNDPKEIIEAKGSKYVPVPLNTILRKVKKSRYKKVAIVGLGCQIEGVRMMQMIDPLLRKKVYLCIGLFCAKSFNFTGTELLLKYYCAKQNNVVGINYRKGNWPGKLSIKTRNKEIEKPFFEYQRFFNQGYFVPECCYFCSNFGNEYADISLGDAWIDEAMKNNNAGSNLIITRTTKGKKLLKTARSINIYKIGPSKVKSSMSSFAYKKQSRKFLYSLAAIFNIDLPKCSDQTEKMPAMSKAVTFTYFLNSVLSNYLPSFFLFLPTFIWRLNSKLEHIAYSIYSKAKK